VSGRPAGTTTSWAEDLQHESDLGRAYDARLLCQSCRARPLAFTRARAPLLYLGAVREAVHAFKYERRHRIGTWLATQMADCAAREFPVSEIGSVVSVPMPWIRRRLRGADSAAALAATLAGRLRLPYRPRVLRRRRWTTTQTRLAPRERFRNVRGAFQACHDDRARHGPDAGPADAAVLLVDDVLTSGATADACATCLLEAGVPRVFVITAARAPASTQT